MVTDTATATGGDDQGEVAGRGAGAGIETDMQVVTGSAAEVELGIETVTEVLTCCRASASV
jgi:microcompartment protein CcmK/EutM